MPFAVFYQDGTSEYQLPDPEIATMRAVAIVDETPSGKSITAGDGLTVNWTFSSAIASVLREADYDAIKARIAADGFIRVRTKNDARQWVIVRGIADPANALSPNFYRGNVPGFQFEVRRGVVVG